MYIHIYIYIYILMNLTQCALHDFMIALVYCQDTNGDYIHHAVFDGVAYCVYT